MFIDEPWNWTDRWPHLQALRDVDAFGRLKEPCDPYWLWLHGTEIGTDEFRYWVKTRQHIKLHDPYAFDADARKRVDLSKAPPIGPRF